MKRIVFVACCLMVISAGPTLAQEPPRVPEASAAWNNRALWGREGSHYQKNSYYWLEGVVSESEYARLVQAARARVREGKFPEAIALFQQAVQIEPQDAPYEELGDALASANRLEEAVATYRTLIYSDSKRGSSPTTLMRYFLLLLRTRQDDEAFPIFQRGIAALPPDEKAIFALDMDAESWKRKKPLMMATAHTVIGRMDTVSRTSDWPKLAALAHYREAIAIEPNYAPALLYRSEIQGEIGRTFDSSYTIRQK